jgi:septal ring factor EnvC (AmiA/AmiB activator)
MRIKRTAKIFVLILAVTAGSLSAFPQKSNDLRKNKLAAINTEIDEINRKLSGLKGKEKSLLNEIYSIELQYEKALIENNKLKLQLRHAGQAIKTKNTEKKQLEKNIAGSKINLRKILRILYKIGGNSYLKLFIRVDSLEQLFHNYRLFTALIGRQSAELEILRTNINRLNQVKQELQASYDQLKSYQQKKEQKVRRIRSLKQGKLNLIGNINNDRKKYLQLLEELRGEASRINEIISGQPSKRPMRTLDLKRLKGRLRWPLRGKVVSSFGKKRSTRFDTYIIENGIKIKPSGSANVRSVYSGEVVFADYFGGYGKVVIVQHSKHLFSVYGHCEKIFKKKGESVEEGELISIAGDSGSTVGRVLYFEIRAQSNAQNPTLWLRKRG